MKRTIMITRTSIFSGIREFPKSKLVLIFIFFYHPDFTVGSGFSPDQSLNQMFRESRTLTAGREFLLVLSRTSHPAPKKILWQMYFNKYRKKPGIEI
jgi:hypothetical protein